jgi:hypothetical protein
MLELLPLVCKTSGIGVGGETKMSYTAKQARMNRAVALGFSCNNDNEYEDKTKS